MRSLASLPMLSDTDLSAMIEQLSAFERELSDDRRRLHGVIDAVEHEIAVRAAATI